MSHELTKTEAPSLVFRYGNFSEALQVAKAIGASQLVPTRFRGKPADILVAWQYGAELGLQPMQALQSIAVINGTPALYGDGLLGVAMSHPLWGGKAEKLVDGVATCTVKRKGQPDTTATFSIEDAKTAGLWGKAGPWTQYWKRMLQMRARAFAIRDAFADVLRGFKTVEELRDGFVEEDGAGVAPAEERAPRVSSATPQTGMASEIPDTARPVQDPTVTEGEVVEAEPTEPSEEPSEALAAMLSAIDKATKLEDLTDVGDGKKLEPEERAVAIEAWRKKRSQFLANEPPKEDFGW